MRCKIKKCRKKADDCHFVCKMHLQEMLAEEGDEEPESEPEEDKITVDFLAIITKLKEDKPLEAKTVLPLLQLYQKLLGLIIQIHHACLGASEEHPLFNEIANVTSAFTGEPQEEI